MARLDKIHEAVVNALIKDGWTITAEPLRLEYEKVNLLIDVAAEKVFAAEKNGRKIAVEIKSFLDPSLLNNLKEAVGQYELYLFYLNALEPERKLYIAIGDSIRERLSALTGIELFLEKKQLPFIVVNLVKEEIVEWIN
jgi:hypothetical protein